MKAEELLEKYAAGQRDFKGAQLSGIDLKGADLSEINLQNANLSGSELSEAIFTKANLGSATSVGLTSAVLI